MATLTVGRGENPTPIRSVEQRKAALHRANAVRTSRAELKREIHARPARIIDVIADPPAWLLTAKVYEILLAIPRLGHIRTRKVLNRHTISLVKTVGGLSDRQRQALIAEMTRFARRYER